MLSVPSHTVCVVELCEFSAVQSLSLVVVVVVVVVVECPAENSKQITLSCYVSML